MSSVFPKLYKLPVKTYGGALRFLKGINPLLAKHQQKENGISKPDANALKNTDDLYELIGRPLDIIPTIHVAGTNGKGSTSYKVAEGLKYSGLRTGLCTGPHISSFRERMQVNGDLVSEMDVVKLLETVIDLCAKHEIPATFFEIAFIMTCLHFQSSKCDVVVLEVGMGGRFDASNVIASHLSVVTSIGMDHMNSLGGTLESIAAHKAGIFKPHTAALVGPGCPMDVMKAEAHVKSTALHSLYAHLQASSAAGLLPPLHSHPVLHIPSPDGIGNPSNHSDSLKDRGDIIRDGDGDAVITTTDVFDPDRLCSQLALASLSLLQHYPSSLTAEGAGRHALFSKSLNTLDPALLDVLLHSRLPCRFEELVLTKHINIPEQTAPASASSDHTDVRHKVKIRVILDVAHNIPALSALMKKINSQFNSNVRVVMGMSRGKGTQECLDVIKEYVAVDKINFIQSDNKRAIAPEELYEAVGNSGGLKRVSICSEHRDGDRGKGSASTGGHAFNMVGGKIAASRYDALHNTLHDVLNEMIGDTLHVTPQEISTAVGGSHICVEEGMGSGLLSRHQANTTGADGPQVETGDVGVVCTDVLVVCGTLYAMPHVRRTLGIMEPNDAFDVDVTL